MGKRIQPRKPPGRQGYAVTFHHPMLKKTVARGLGCREETKAMAIAHDLEQLCLAPELWKNLKNPKLLMYEQKALEVFFGKEKVAHLANQRRAYSKKDAVQAAKTLAEVRDRGRAGAETAAEGNLSMADVQKLLRTYNPQRFKQMEEELTAAKVRIKELEKKEEELKQLWSEYAKLQRKQNKHARAPLEAARLEWEEAYRSGHAEKTIREAKDSVKRFVDFVGKHKPVGDIKAYDVDRYLTSVKAKDGSELAPRTKQKFKEGISTFWTWAVRRYDLFENIMWKSGRVPGANRPSEKIEAIRKRKEIDELIDTLKPSPYWQAWVATAILAGPRYDEQARLRVEDVYLDENYILIRSRKTGRQRRVPIETTKLKKILKDWMKQAKGTLVFPAQITRKRPRVKTDEGLWSSHRNFLDNWRKSRDEILKDLKKNEPKKKKVAERDYWSYGPREWRHTFGTVLGMCGWNSLEISRAMGNSPMVADRHYIAEVSAANRWTFKWS